MPRHRGRYDPLRSEPYELSRYRIENFIKCPACFYLQQVAGVKFPSIPGYNINEATDAYFPHAVSLATLYQALCDR